MSEHERLREAADRVLEKRRLETSTWRPDPRPADHVGRGWRDGYITAMAEVTLILQRALDPDGMAEHVEQWQVASYGSDREWFDLTGNCGHCGNYAEDCLCTDDDPCECGPHLEKRTWPRDCGWCKGTGKVEPVRRPAAVVGEAEQ